MSRLPPMNKAKLEKGIARLEKLARKEKQPKKKYEYVRQIKKLYKEIENAISDL